MTCDDVRDRLVELETMGPSTTSDHRSDPEVDSHLAGCSACRDELASIRELVRRVRAAVGPVTETGSGPDVHVVTPPPLEAVLEAVRARDQPRRARQAVRRLLQAAALLAAAVLGVMVDRALVRASSPDVLPPSPTTSTTSGPPVDVDTTLREALAERPGGLAASLALLDAISSGAAGRR